MKNYEIILEIRSEEGKNDYRRVTNNWCGRVLISKTEGRNDLGKIGRGGWVKNYKKEDVDKSKIFLR